MSDLYNNFLCLFKSLRSLREPSETWMPMRLKDRVFANMVQLEDRFTWINSHEFNHGFERGPDATTGPLSSTLLLDDDIKNKPADMAKKGDIRVRDYT